MIKVWHCLCKASSTPRASEESATTYVERIKVTMYHVRMLLPRSKQRQIQTCTRTYTEEISHGLYIYNWWYKHLKEKKKRVMSLWLQHSLDSLSTKTYGTKSLRLIVLDSTEGRLHSSFNENCKRAKQQQFSSEASSLLDTAGKQTKEKEFQRKQFNSWHIGQNLISVKNVNRSSLDSHVWIRHLILQASFQK